MRSPQVWLAYVFRRDQYGTALLLILTSIVLTALAGDAGHQAYVTTWDGSHLRDGPETVSVLSSRMDD